MSKPGRVRLEVDGMGLRIEDDDPCAEPNAQSFWARRRIADLHEGPPPDRRASTTD